MEALVDTSEDVNAEDGDLQNVSEAIEGVHQRLIVTATPKRHI
jgi:hypothetical protein